MKHTGYIGTVGPYLTVPTHSKPGHPRRAQVCDPDSTGECRLLPSCALALLAAFTRRTCPTRGRALQVHPLTPPLLSSCPDHPIRGQKHSPDAPRTAPATLTRWTGLTRWRAVSCRAAMHHHAVLVRPSRNTSAPPTTRRLCAAAVKSPRPSHPAAYVPLARGRCKAAAAHPCQVRAIW